MLFLLVSHLETVLHNYFNNESTPFYLADLSRQSERLFRLPIEKNSMFAVDKRSLHARGCIRSVADR